MKISLKAELPKHLFIGFILLMAFFPLYLMITISFKTNGQFMHSPWYPFVPFHLENWTYAWGIVSHYIFNTIVVAISAVALTFCLTLPASFFFARYKMPFSNVMWYIFLILMLMPGIANIVPLFMLLKHLHLLNSLFALIIVGITGAQVVQIYVLRSFIEDIPNDLFEAAEIDGAGPIKQIIHVVLPLSGSIVSTLAILQFMGAWNDFILPMIVIRDDSLLTLAAGLVKLDGEYVKMWGQMMAGYSIASIPLVLIFLFTMRLFVKGLSAGAVKG
jgi:ABC-type glycerol-3-phosphate transport system permease component